MTKDVKNAKSNNYSEFNPGANEDYSGARHLLNSQELVEFRGKSLHRVWLNDLPIGYATHWHAAMEIILPVESGYTAIVGDNTYDIKEGDIFFIPPRMLHSLEAPPTGRRFIYIMNVSFITSLRGYAGIEPIISQPMQLSSESNPGLYEDVYDILVQIRNEYYKNSEFAELSIQAMLLNLFVKLGESHSRAEELFPTVRPYKQKEYVQRFNQALEYINSNYTEDITLEFLAAETGFSKYHFSRLFKQYTGYTFCDYLCYRRVKAAQELLDSPDYSVTEVASYAGFSSISTFNRLFKQQMGCTPSEYRKKKNYSLKTEPLA